jgi:hypothetical protein
MANRGDPAICRLCLPARRMRLAMHHWRAERQISYKNGMPAEIRS